MAVKTMPWFDQAAVDSLPQLHSFPQTPKKRGESSTSENEPSHASKRQTTSQHLVQLTVTRPQQKDAKRAAPESFLGAYVDRKPSKDELLAGLHQAEICSMGVSRSVDKDANERHLKVQRRMHQFQRAIAGMEDNEMIFMMFENIEDEIQEKDELLKKKREQVHELKQDMKDLIDKFECDRTQFLQTIHEQEKRLKLYQNIIVKMVQSEQRDTIQTTSNSVTTTTRWSCEKEQWAAVPPQPNEMVHLPTTGGESLVPAGQYLPYPHQPRSLNENYTEIHATPQQPKWSVPHHHEDYSTFWYSSRGGQSSYEPDHGDISHP